MALTRRDKEKIKKLKKRKSSLVFSRSKGGKLTKKEIATRNSNINRQIADIESGGRSEGFTRGFKSSSRDRDNDRGGLLSGLSNATSNIGGLLSSDRGNNLVNNLAKISPVLPFPLNVIGTGYNLYNLFRGNKEPTETFPIPRDKPNDLTPLINTRDKTPQELVNEVRFGGRSFSEPFRMAGGGSIPSVFSQPVGTEVVQTGVESFQGRTRPTTEIRPLMSTGLLDILGDANIGSQYQTLPQPDPNQLNVFPTAVDLSLLANANVGSDYTTRTPQDIDFRLGVSPLEYSNFLGSTDVSDQLLAELNESGLLGGFNADINRNLAPATLENPIQYTLGNDAIINNASANLLGYTPSTVGSSVVPLQDFSYRQLLDYQNSLQSLRDRAAGFPNTNINITGY